MKKQVLTLAVAAGLVASAGVASAEPTVYGRIHLALEQSSDGGSSVPKGNSGLPEDFNMESRKSVIGVKGTEDLGGGLKAFYKLEWDVDVDGGGALAGRDQFLGLKGGWGKVKLGKGSSNYKQMGGKMDPFWHHAAEGRGYSNTMSSFHGGKGTDRGRQTNMVQYTTPKMGGIEVVANYTISGATSAPGGPAPCSASTGGGQGSGLCDGDEVLGVGARWSNKSWLAFVDYIDPDQGGTGPVGSPAAGFADESIVKIGGKFTAKNWSAAAQYEAAEDQTGGDYIFLAGTFDINKNNALALTVGQHSDVSDGLAVGYTHKMSKKTKVYIDYSAISEDSTTSCASLGVCDDSVVALGIVKSF